MDLLRVDTSSETPLYAQIVDRVRAGVRAGTLRAGAALPSVRQLASDLGVNANTVAKAYLLLEREGVLTTAGRRGTFVSKDAVDRVRRMGEETLEDRLDRMLEDMDRLGVDREKLLRWMKRRLSWKVTDRSPGGDV